MTATVTVHDDAGRIVGSLSVGDPLTMLERRELDRLVRLAARTRLRLAAGCACLESRDTGAVVEPCEAHARMEARAS